MNLNGLDRETKALALAGYFLQEFAIAEEQVTAALGQLLGLNGAQQELLLADMPVARKFKALKELAPDLPKQFDGDKIAKCMAELLKLNSTIRIHLAHKRFGPGGKDLAIYKSGWPDEVMAAWSAEEFLSRLQVLVGTRRPLMNLVDGLSMIETERLLREHNSSLSARLSASRILFGDRDE